MLVHRIRMKRRGRFGAATRRVGSGAYPSQAAINWVHLYKMIYMHSSHGKRKRVQNKYTRTKSAIRALLA